MKGKHGNADEQGTESMIGEKQVDRVLWGFSLMASRLKLAHVLCREVKFSTCTAINKSAVASPAKYPFS